MKKSVFILTIIVIAIVLTIGAISIYLNRSKYVLNVTNVNDVLSIEFMQEGNNVIITSVDKINEIISVMFGMKKVTKEASINDSPQGLSNYITIKINYKNNEKDVLYVYEKSNKYFLEQPYNGIYRISSYEYNFIKNYLK